MVMTTAAGEEEEEGYEDDYQLEDLELAAADYIKAEAVSNFRNAWEAAEAESEMTDDYGLGVKDSLQVRFRRESFPCRLLLCHLAQALLAALMSSFYGALNVLYSLIPGTFRSSFATCRPSFANPDLHNSMHHGALLGRLDIDGELGVVRRMRWRQ